MSYAELYQPTKKLHSTIYNALLVLSASLLIAISAQISIPIPFGPVPITGQTFTVLLIAAVLGKRRGIAAVTLYLTEGALGFPVFAGAKGGFAALLGPTGGYLAGFVASAYLVAHLVERGWDRKVWSSTLAMVLGNLAIYLCGLTWLSAFVGRDQVLALGLMPFLVGDGLKIILASGLLAISGTLKPEVGN
ncbi:MAG: biotin transporter BioY [Anaerolineales bacterium]